MGEIIRSTESEKHLAFEWLRHVALDERNARTSRFAAIMLSEHVRLSEQGGALIEAVQYAVNRLDTDGNQPQVASDLAIALAAARS